MKTLLTSKAITNGGDYLFTAKGIEISKKFLGENNVTYVNAITYDTDKFLIDEYDSLIVIGGPLYCERLLTKGAFPLIYDAMDKGKKIFFLGAGNYLSDDKDEIIWNELFHGEVKEMLQYINNNGILGCRDYLSQRILLNNGFNNVIMTGCPVWYYDNVEDRTKLPSIHKIIFSDAGVTKDGDIAKEKYVQTINLLKYLSKKFTGIQLVYSFNNGIETKYSYRFNTKVLSFLKESGISYIDLSGTADKFALYDDFDLHIGYRLHSHMYSISHKIPSILICEDARGIGYNKVFGLENIKCYEDTEKGYINNPYLIQQLNAVLDEEISTHFIKYDYIYQYFKYYYKTNLTNFFEIVKR